MKIKKEIKRILCSFLSIFMIVSFCPVTAGASTINEVTFTAVAGTAGETNESFPKLIDGNTSTKWCVTDFESAYIILEASEAVAVSGYSMTTGNDTADFSGRNPKNWTLYGCNDYNAETGTGTWTSIHNVENDDLLPAENKTTVNYTFDKTETEYKYFKLDITANHSEGSGSDCMQISEFALVDCDHSFATDEVAVAKDDDEHDVYNVTKCSVCGWIKSKVYAESSAHTYNNGICSACGAIEVKDMVGSLAGATAVTLPASFDYKLGSENVLYRYNTDLNRYAKLVKIDITAQDIGKTLALNFDGKNEYVDTYLYLFKQNGDTIEYLNKTDYPYLTYNITEAGTYYIALAGYTKYEIGLCHADIKLVDKKDMVEGCKAIDTATTLPSSFDYELGSENVIYSSSYGNDAYAKLVKIDITAQDIGKTLFMNFDGKNGDVETMLYLFKQNGTEIEYVSQAYASLSYKINTTGTYYIALAGYSLSYTGLYHAEIKLIDVKDMVESFNTIETTTTLPSSFDYELGSENVIYDDAYAKLVKIDITAQDIGKTLSINFAGKNGSVNTYLYLYKQNGDTIVYLNETDNPYLTYNITEAGTYYIALAGYSKNDIGLCHAEIKLNDVKDMVESFNTIETTTTLPSSFDYELGSENVLYKYNTDEIRYAKLVKIDVTAQDIGKILYINFDGKNSYVDTMLYLFKQNGTEIEYVSQAYASLSYKINTTGTYYIALAGYNNYVTSLCHAEIELIDAKDMVESLSDAETVTLPASFDYELGSEDVYVDPYDDACFAKLLRVDVTETGKTLFISFEGKNEAVDTYLYLFKQNEEDIDLVDDTSKSILMYEIEEQGTYYIALDGYDLEVTGLCHAEIKLLDNPVYGTLDFDSETVPVPEEGALWSWDAATLTLTLKDGFVIIADEDDAIVLPDGATLIVEEKAMIIADDDDDGIQYNGNLTIKGNGMNNSMLTIHSYDDGIYNYECGDLLIEDCGFIIRAGDDGVSPDGNLTIKNCSFDIVSDDYGIYNSEDDTDIIIENSKIKIIADEEGILVLDGNITISDCDVNIDTTSDEEGILIDNSDTGNDYTLTITGGTLVIAALEEALEAPEIVLTDVKFDIRTTDSDYDLVYMDSYSEFSLPGFFCLYDIDGNVLYRGEWASELLDDDGILCVDGVKVYRAVSYPDDAPFIKGDNGKMGWDAISEEITASDDGDTITVDMNGSTEIPKDILSDIKGKDIDLVLDMGNGFTWTINGKKVTEPKDVDLGVSEGSNIPVQVINNLTGERSHTTITLAYDGDFGFEAVLTVNLGSDNSGAYANLYYYNGSNSATEFISSGLIGSNGKAGLTFTHASEYVIVIDSYSHGDIGAGDNSTDLKVPVIAAFASLVTFGAVVSTKKRKNELA